MTTKEQVIVIIKEIKPTIDLENITDIIDGGYLDSFELINLIAMLNEIFAVEVSLDEIIPENFNSIDAISKMVEKLKNI